MDSPPVIRLRDRVIVNLDPLPGADVQEYVRADGVHRGVVCESHRRHLSEPVGQYTVRLDSGAAITVDADRVTLDPEQAVPEEPFSCRHPDLRFAVVGHHYREEAHRAHRAIVGFAPTLDVAQMNARRCLASAGTAELEVVDTTTGCTVWRLLATGEIYEIRRMALGDD